jgi:hypothetical protein
MSNILFHALDHIPTWCMDVHAWNGSHLTELYLKEYPCRPLRPSACLLEGLCWRAGYNYCKPIFKAVESFLMSRQITLILYYDALDILGVAWTPYGYDSYSHDSWCLYLELSCLGYNFALEHQLARSSSRSMHHLGWGTYSKHDEYSSEKSLIGSP